MSFNDISDSLCVKHYITYEESILTSKCFISLQVNTSNTRKTGACNI